MLGSIISGVGNAIGGIFGAKQSGKNVQAQIQANKELAQYQYSKDLEMWNRQNEYNSPSEAMERFREAGINPNLVVEGASSWGQAKEMPKYQSVTADYTKVQNKMAAVMQTLGMFNDFRLKNAQVSNMNAVSRSANAKASLDEMRKEVLSGISTGKRYEWDKEKNKYVTSYDYDTNYGHQVHQALMKSMSDIDRNISQVQLQSQEQQLRQFEINMWKTLQNENFSGTKFEKMTRDFFRAIYLRK